MEDQNNQTKNRFPHEISRTSATGSHDFHEKQFMLYLFGKYEITVELTSDNKFVGIVEVKINKDFRSYSQKIASTKVHDTEDYYKDE
jgi:hypothetical protein